MPQQGGSIELGRLRWRCRRGMKELDVLLERYVHSRLPLASVTERCVFAALLDLPDPLLADYLLGHAIAAEPALARLARAILAVPPERSPRPSHPIPARPVRSAFCAPTM